MAIPNRILTGPAAADDDCVLLDHLRAKPEGTKPLAARLHRRVADVRADVARLAAQGLLARSGGRWHVRPPGRCVGQAESGRCRRVAVLGSTYCAYHAEQAAVTAAPPRPPTEEEVTGAALRRVIVALDLCGWPAPYDLATVLHKVPRLLDEPRFAVCWQRLLTHQRWWPQLIEVAETLLRTQSENRMNGVSATEAVLESPDDMVTFECDGETLTMTRREMEEEFEDDES